mmetsp:Transcript_43197/g.78578  ORF Transcript_43197/g.78578 Transcript_43197/m.78578 type:complete len:345 (+) Transcript_43197:39-1073(+)
MIAEPWPSQRLKTSDRHTALDRMRQRHAREAAGGDVQMCGGKQVDVWRGTCAARPHSERASRARRELDADDDLRQSRFAPDPHPPSCPPPAEPSGRPGTSRSARPAPTHEELRVINKAVAVATSKMEGTTLLPDRDRDRDRPATSSLSATTGGASGSGRVRGPATARSVRDGLDDQDDEPLPAGAQSANFGTLQDMISKGIREAEVSAGHLEKAVADDMQERQRRQQENRRRRDSELLAKQAEREKARKERRRAEETKQKALLEELERSARLKEQQRLEKQASEEKDRRKHAAATRIQARLRGAWSRQGRTKDCVRGQPCTKSISVATTAASSLGGSPEPELLK